MLINQIAQLSGVSVRTLRYYDSIGLLSPVAVTESGYRQYDEGSLLRLQQILFFKELGFSLHEILDIMGNPNYEIKAALAAQRNLLILKRDRMERMIKLVESEIRGENTMSFEQLKTDELELAKKRYAEEARRRWGDTNAYREYAGKPQTDTNDDTMDELLHRFALIRHLPVSGSAAQELVKEWQAFITANYYTCTNEILGCLGQMYVADDRFKANIDKHGEGTALFIAHAIEYHCSNTD